MSLLDVNTLFDVAAVAAAISLVILIYFFVVRPKREHVFSEERPCGPWTVVLGRLGRTLEGEVCTARQTYEGVFARMITSAMKMSKGPDDKTVENLCKERDDVFESSHLFAQKSQEGDVLYIFDKNPEDQNYHTALGERRFIHSVQDCESWGKDEHGIELISVKLSAATAKYTPEERDRWKQIAEAIKWSRLAASNSGENAHLLELLETKEVLLENSHRETRREATRADTATTAAGIRPLAEPSIPAEKPSVFGAISKKFLSRGQIIVGIISLVAWFLSDSILRGLGVVVPDPNALGILIALGVFFGIPIFRGWISERKRG